MLARQNGFGFFQFSMPGVDDDARIFVCFYKIRVVGFEVFDQLFQAPDQYRIGVFEHLFDIRLPHRAICDRGARFWHLRFVAVDGGNISIPLRFERS